MRKIPSAHIPGGSVAQMVLMLVVLGVSSAAVQFEGKVIDHQTGLPLDSVRVVSTLYRQTVLTGNDGVFTIDYDSFKACPPETITTTIIYETSVTAIANGQLRRVLDKSENPLQAAIFDVHGRCIERTSFAKKFVQFPERKLAAGMYLLKISGLPPMRILVAGPRGHGIVGVKRQTDISVQTMHNPRYDTMVLYKEGYAVLSLPADDIDERVPAALRKKRWLASDIHNHTVLTDGAFILDSVLSHALGKNGLDVYVNSEHGGSSYQDTSGPAVSIDVPRWYSLVFHSWPKLLGQRKRHPGKILLQGLEWDCPGHEHASVGIIDDVVQPGAIAHFEYQFDFNDTDTGMPWLMKRNGYQHDNAIAAITWLRNNYAQSSYCFVNHPSRESTGPYYIEHFRDFHNAAPDIFLGFEGMPGHHKNPMRGSYGRRMNEPRLRTWGGADNILAKVGGLWDALLGEGRHLWVIVNSDFHATGYDFWPGEYAKTWSTVTDTGARAWLDGMKSGEIFIAHGDLVSELSFSIDDGINHASMGSDLWTEAKELLLSIRFKSPETNNHGDPVRVDHVDLITGSITGIVDSSDHDAYTTPVNPTTRVMQRFTANDWVLENGYAVIRTTITSKQSAYFRLRGTSLAVGTAGEVDAQGNPMMDEDYNNTETIAWRDLWFYSNPIFVYRK